MKDSTVPTSAWMLALHDPVVV